jgi:hypothetical protein
MFDLKGFIRMKVMVAMATVMLCLAPVCLAKTAAKDAPFTVVIDAGHGGKDVGAKGKKTNEKSVNLDVALALGRLIEKEYGKKEVKVVYTRDGDYFVTLQGRCDKANKANGNLFISIHCNSVDEKSPRRNTVNGASVYTLGLGRSKENLEVAKRENSVMMLEPDYTTTYSGFDPNSAESYIVFEMTQNRHLNQSIKFAALTQKQLVSNAGRADKGIRQDIFWVLVHTGMPAVLIELDFICNPTVEKFMMSDKGVDKMATSIFNAFCDYYKSSKKAAKAASK